MISLAFIRESGIPSLAVNSFHGHILYYGGIWNHDIPNFGRGLIPWAYSLRWWQLKPWHSKALDFNSTGDFSSSFWFQIQVANFKSTSGLWVKWLDSDFIHWLIPNPWLSCKSSAMNSIPPLGFEFTLLRSKINHLIYIPSLDLNFIFLT